MRAASDRGKPLYSSSLRRQFTTACASCCLGGMSCSRASSLPARRGARGARGAPCARLRSVELAPTASAAAGGRATAGRLLVLDHGPLGRNDVPLAAAQVEPLASGLSRRLVAHVGVERPLGIRDHTSARRVLVRPEERRLRRATGSRLARALPLQRGPEARARARARDTAVLVLHEDVERVS